jgi:hypothetical protein
LDHAKVSKEQIVEVTDLFEKGGKPKMFEAVLARIDEAVRRGEEADERIRIAEERIYREKLESARKLKQGGVSLQIIADSLTLPPDIVEGL